MIEILTHPAIVVSLTAYFTLLIVYVIAIKMEDKQTRNK